MMDFLPLAFFSGLVGTFFTALAVTLSVAVVVSLVVGLRTDLEDRTLEAELAGYASYRERVKYRLLPWV